MDIHHRSSIIQTLISTEEERCIAEHCQNYLRSVASARPKQVIPYCGYAVKFGQITCEEAENQYTARTMLESKIICVPKIYSFFTREGMDFLVMELVTKAAELDSIDQSTIEQVADIALHLHQITSNTPGPLVGGKCRSLLWGDEEYAFSSTADLEAVIGSRLLRNTFSTKNSVLSLVHGDLRPSNILISRSGIYLLDWEFAAFLPRAAEIAVLQHGFAQHIEERTFRERLAMAIACKRPLCEVEAKQVDAFREYAYNIIAFARPTSTRHPKKKPRRPQ